MQDFLARHRFVPCADNGGYWQDEDGQQVMRLFAYAGPNLMRLEACGALVMLPNCLLNRSLSASEIEKVGRLLQHVGQPMAQPEPPSGHLADWLRLLLLQLQRRRFFPVSWGRFRHRSDGAAEMAFELGRATWAGRLANHALALLQAALHDPEGASIRQVLKDMENSLVPRLSHLYRLDRHRTAARLGIYRPTTGLLDVTWSYMGQGKDACLITGGGTSRTSDLGKKLAGDKNMALSRLRANGLPVLPQHVASTYQQALAATSQLGYPVVVKPLRGRQSKGVTVNVRNDEALRVALQHAQTYYPQAVVEPYLPGLNYRILVIGGRFVAASQRSARALIGDGHSSINQLVAQANETVRGTGLFFSPISLDDDALATLATQQLTPESVPLAGQQVRIREMASPESTATDVTDEVHPDNRTMAIEAAQACLLDVAGIDFVSPDIAVSWRANGARIIEVNSGPAADLHMFPQEGLPRDVSWHLIRSCLPATAPGRLPVVMCVGEEHARAYLDPIVEGLVSAGWHAGQPPSDLADSNADPTSGVAGLLTNAAIDAAAFFWPLSCVTTIGFPVDRVRVAVITNVPHSLPQTELSSWGDDVMLRIGRLACDLATDSVVIDGSNPLLRAAVAHRPAEQVGYLWWAGVEVDDTPLRQHLAAGGWAVSATGNISGDSGDSRASQAQMVAQAVMRVMPHPDRTQPGNTVSHPYADANTACALTSRTLAQTFGGAWVNGPDRDWPVTRWVTKLSSVEPGDVFVCPGAPNDLTRINDNDAKILQAFSLGARAVIATQVPCDLARWQAVLVCDDPQSGLLKMEST